MIEPVEQFGICWHCDNLMVRQYKDKWDYSQVASGEYLRWEARCTKMGTYSRAVYPSSSADRFSQGEQWCGIDGFIMSPITCSKYKVLSW